MAYFEKIGTYFTDSPNLDAFGRVRTSTPKTLFDSKLLNELSVGRYWSNRIYGNATASYDTYGSYINMSVDISSGSRCINQTKQKFIYEPGKSLLITATGQFNAGIPGIEKYIMYGNDQSGLGFCMSGSSFGVFKRKTTATGTTTTFISQSSWNIDTFDGNGPSTKLYDPSKSQIHFIDMEWLGVGRVRYGVFQGGQPYVVHQFEHINELTEPYMGSPNLNVRYEIVNISGSSTSSSMKQICCSVTSEGGSDNLGVLRSVDSNNTAITVNAGTHVGTLYVRQITASVADGWKGNHTRVTPSNISLFPNGTQNIRWTLQLNPVVADAATLTYERIPSSSIEYATGSSTTTINSSSHVLLSGYIPGGTNQAGANDIYHTLDPFFALGEDLYGTRDVLVLTVQEIEGTGIPVYSQMSVKEVI